MRRALAFLHGLAVDVHRGTDVRVAHELLLYLHRSPGFIKQGPEGMSNVCQPIRPMPQRMPAGMM